MLTATDPEAAKVVTKIFGRSSVEETREEAALLMFINILVSSYNAARMRVIKPELHNSHMKSFFDHFGGDTEVLFKRLETLGYDANFIQECRRYARK